MICFRDHLDIRVLDTVFREYTMAPIRNRSQDLDVAGSLGVRTGPRVACRSLSLIPVVIVAFLELTPALTEFERNFLF